MTAIIVDATVFILFGRAQRFSLLPKLLASYDVSTTAGVVREVSGGPARDRPGASELEDARRIWIAVREVSLSAATPAAKVVPGLSDVDREVLGLAEELDGLLATDDGALRTEAEARDLVVVGSLGLLEGSVRVGALEASVALEVGSAFVNCGLRINRSIFQQWCDRLSQQA